MAETITPERKVKSMPQLAHDTSRMVIYLNQDLHAWVKTEAGRQHRSMSNFIQTVLLSLRDQQQEGQE